MADDDVTEIEVKGEREIGNNTEYDSFQHAKKPIVHYLITVKQGANNGVSRALIYEAQFKGKEYEEDGASLAQVIEFCRVRAANGSGRNPGAAESPLDMAVSEQCWLVVELDSTVNWHYARDARACTSKHSNSPHGLGGHNLWLRHVYADGRALEKTTKDDLGVEGCRVLFFGVAHRGHPKRNTSEHHYFNLKIEYFQLSADGRNLVLPVVLDPDVGNDGHDEIPPP